MVINLPSEGGRCLFVSKLLASWNRKIHSRVHEIPPLNPMRNKFNADHTVFLQVFSFSRALGLHNEYGRNAEWVLCPRSSVQPVSGALSR
jgi:hypothetical protein